MKACTLCGVSKPLDDFHKHPYGALGRASRCKPCHNAQTRANYHADKQAHSDRMRAWREANAETLREKKRVYAAEYRQRAEAKALQRDTAKRWRASNREHVLRRERERRQTNPNVRVWKAVAQASRRRQMSAWADRRAIQALYREAKRMTLDTGVVHHVDHVIPLKHPLVCGLHVETNLRVIPADENLRKWRHWEP